MFYSKGKESRDVVYSGHADEIFPARDCSSNILISTVEVCIIGEAL